MKNTLVQLQCGFLRCYPARESMHARGILQLDNNSWICRASHCNKVQEASSLHLNKRHGYCTTTRGMGNTHWVLHFNKMHRHRTATRGMSIALLQEVWVLHCNNRHGKSHHNKKHGHCIALQGVKRGCQARPISIDWSSPEKTFNWQQFDTACCPKEHPGL